MKKLLRLLSLILVICLLLSSCASDPPDDGGNEVTIGTNGNWYIGTTDTGVKAAGTDGATPTIGANGNWYIGSADTGVKASKSTFELYKQVFGYEGSEADWLADLLSGNLTKFELAMDNVPNLAFRVFVGEKFFLPQTMLAYLIDGSQIDSDVKWDRNTVDTSFAGVKNIYGKVKNYPELVKCTLLVEKYFTSESSVTGTVNGLLNNEKAVVSVYNENYCETTVTDQKGLYRFDNIPYGQYNVKVDVAGYRVTAPISISLSKVTNTKFSNVAHANFDVSLVTDDYFYSWQTDQYFFGSEVSSNVNQKADVDFLTEDLYASNSAAAVQLQSRYNITLLDGNLSWGSEFASRLLDMVETLPNFDSTALPSVWQLTNSSLKDDIAVVDFGDYSEVTLTTAIFKNAIPKTVTIDGVKGKYFSNRLYNAVTRFFIFGGNEQEKINKIESIFNARFGCSILPPDYGALTQNTTSESSGQFQQFSVEELITILNMFAEMPTGYHVVGGLNYLVRRKNGLTHPMYPTSPAVAWTKDGYIEFMESAFLTTNIEHMYRLIIHEKTHFLWEHLFSDELKQSWIEIGGWFEDLGDPDGWSTTKTTEFVSDYAHGYNPDEDMAESVSYYIVNPDKLKAVSKGKYDFIKDYIMHGDIYLREVREDLTFEVYNLFPDYDYPGKISKLEITVNGDVFDDKTVDVMIQLNDGDGLFDGASEAYLRITSSIGTFYDLRLYPTQNAHVLSGTLVISKYSKAGFWAPDQIVVTDLAGNQRFEGTRDFGWKLYIDNPSEITVAPQIVSTSVKMQLYNEKDPASSKDLQRLEISFEVDSDFMPATNAAMVRLAYLNNADVYSVDEWGVFDFSTNKCFVNFYFTEYHQSGSYQIRQITLQDIAQNVTVHYYYDDILSKDNLVTNIVTTNPDTTPPELDLNKISVSATPINPTAPDGETLVTIKYWVRDDKSGLGIVSYSLIDPQGVGHFEYHYHKNFFTMFFDGNATAWTEYTISIILPKGSAPGTWGLLEMTLIDKAQNISMYSFSEIVHFEIL